MLYTSDKFYVLAYHKVQDCANFERQLIFLKANYSIIGYSDLHNHFINNTELPPKAVLLTFDDGDYTNYTKAFPLMRKHGFPAIFFVVTSLINSELPFWWEELSYYLGKDKGNEKTWEVKGWPNQKRVEFIEKLSTNSKFIKLRTQQLNNEELKELQNSGITIANHSHSHPILNTCEENELDLEFNNSIKILKELKLTYDVFAYPNGNSSELSEKKLREYQIKFAFLFDHRINSKSIDPLRISRLIVNDSTPLWKLKLIMSGVHTQILPITRFVGKLKNYLKK